MHYEIDIVKRRTINELEQKGEIFDLDTNIILDTETEKRFHKKVGDNTVEFLRLMKALNRRWIRNPYDYLVSPTDKLKLVQGLYIKLLEADKHKIINNLKL